MKPASPVDEIFFDLSRDPAEMDALWAQGWRHFGPLFFRYSHSAARGGERTVIPLRIDLSRFFPSKSQRRILRKNVDLQVRVESVRIDSPRDEMFAAHKTRFQENVPEDLRDFLGYGAESDVPCVMRELSVRGSTGQLLAASYIALGEASHSSIYAMFDPVEARRSLGIATQLWEFQHARELGKRWHYLGYAFRESSFYDYKKQFSGLEWFDWTEWQTAPLPD